MASAQAMTLSDLASMMVVEYMDVLVDKLREANLRPEVCQRLLPLAINRRLTSNRFLELLLLPTLVAPGVASIVDLSAFDRMTDSFITSLCRSAAAPTIQTLKLDMCNSLTDESIRLIAAQLPSLQSLSLRHCHWVSDKTLPLIPTTIRSLSLAGCGRSTVITEPALHKTLFTRCADHLVELDLAHCRFLTSGLVRSIAHDLPNLISLNLAWPPSSSPDYGDYIHKLPNHCPKLTSLVLAGSATTNDAVVSKILSGCVSLTCLDVSNCPAVFLNDKAFKALGQLQSLSLGGPSITDQVLSRLLPACLSLQSLDLSNAQSKITSDGIKAALDVLPPAARAKIRTIVLGNYCLGGNLTIKALRGSFPHISFVSPFI